MSSELATSPALPPPDGQQSNFVDPPSIQPAIVGALTSCLAVSTLSAVLRCYAQWSIFGKLLWADAWMLLGWTFHVAFAAFLYACLPYGAGRHQWDVTKSDYGRIHFLLFVDFILYDIAVLGPKVSILLQLRDIFVPHGRGTTAFTRFYHWMTVALVAVNILFYVSLSFALIFQCDPVKRGWDETVPGRCLNQNSLLQSSGPFNIVTDFLIFLLPLASIWRLHLPVRERLVAASGFAVGFFGCICSSVRLYYSDRLHDSGDATYLVFQNQLWANAEITTGILIANMIIVPRFLRFVRVVNKAKQDHPLSRVTRSVKDFGRSQRNAVISEPYIELNDTSSGIRQNEIIQAGYNKG